METESFSSKIIEQLKIKHISPKPRWEFVLKNVALWLTLAILLVVGSLASSIIIFMIDTNQWDLYDNIRHNALAFFLASLPYFWLIFLGLFILGIYYYFRQTKSGYKFHAYAIVLASFILSSVLGLVLYNAGLAHAIDRVFEEKVPMYGKIINSRQNILSHPEFGILPGKIIQVISPSELVIIDISNHPWGINLAPSVKDCPCFPGNRIIAVGEKQANNNFVAYEIRELRPNFKRPQRVWQYFQLRIFQPLR